MAIQKPPRLPDPQFPWVDPRTGRPSDAAYQYFRDMDRILRELVDKANDLEARVTTLESA